MATLDGPEKVAPTTKQASFCVTVLLYPDRVSSVSVLVKGNWYPVLKLLYGSPLTRTVQVWCPSPNLVKTELPELSGIQKSSGVDRLDHVVTRVSGGVSHVLLVMLTFFCVSRDKTS